MAIFTENNIPNICDQIKSFFEKTRKGEAKKGRELLINLFLSQQKEWEISGHIDFSQICAHSCAAMDIDAIGTREWLKNRWSILERYDKLSDKDREYADICFIVMLKIFDFNKAGQPITFGKLVDLFNCRLEIEEISMAESVLFDRAFIKHYTGFINSQTRRITNGLITISVEIPTDLVKE